MERNIYLNRVKKSKKDKTDSSVTGSNAAASYDVKSAPAVLNYKPKELSAEEEKEKREKRKAQKKARKNNR